MYKLLSVALVLFPLVFWGASVSAQTTQTNTPSEKMKDLTTTQGVTGKELLRLCSTFVSKSSSMDPSQYTRNDYYCLGFISGAVESQHFISFYKAVRDKDYRQDMTNKQFAQLMKKYHLFCLNNAVYLKGLVPVVVTYAKTHPELLDYPAGVLLYSALREKFPCD